MFKEFVAAAIIWATLTSAAYAQAIGAYDRDIEMFSLEHGGAARSVGLYVPSSYSAGRPAPLIVALHGRSSSAKALHALSGLAAVAEARGAIVLYPEALGGAWHGGPQSRSGLGQTPAESAAFVADAVAAITADYAIDAARIFLVGFDSGGAVAFRMACRGPLQLAGVAIVSALMWEASGEACGEGAAPTPMLIVHGRRDEYFPVNGSSAGASGTRLSVDDTIAVWRRINGCPERASASARGDSAVYTNCSAAGLAYVGVAGGEHDWFHTGDAYQLNRQGVDATALINSFFFDRSGFVLPTERGGGDRARSYIVYAPPSYNPGRPMPAVVLLHGRPGNAPGMALITQMNEVAARHGFIVVYPDGIDNEWNAQFDLAGRGVSLGGQRSTLPQDDVGFLETLMQDLRVDLNIDPRRMYLGGFSNGGFMTHRMACSAGDTFAAFAEVGAALYTELTEHCRRSPPTPILMMHGTGDPSVPYAGVQVANPDGGDPIRITLSVQATVASFIYRNHCNLAGASTTFAEGGHSPGTHVVRFVPRDCDPGADVMFYLINGGGHVWPGVTGMLDEANFGLTNMDINAGEVIWDFFADHALAEAPAAR
jgi:polyhydroxybutyrate depolymerase